VLTLIVSSIASFSIRAKSLSSLENRHSLHPNLESPTTAAHLQSSAKRFGHPSPFLPSGNELQMLKDPRETLPQQAERAMVDVNCRLLFNNWVEES
jgi:hypothetical protein